MVDTTATDTDTDDEPAREHALTTIGEVRNQLVRLQGNAAVENYAAEEYIDEALDRLDAATVDLRHSRHHAEEDA